LVNYHHFCTGTAVKKRHGKRGQKGGDAFVLALASGLSIRQAARKAGIGETTAYKRAADPELKSQVSALRRELLARAVGKLVDTSAGAVDALAKLLRSKSEAIRLSAIRTVLDHAAKGITLTDVVGQMEELQALLKEYRESESESSQANVRDAG
jgi:hypothetical protein